MNAKEVQKIPVIKGFVIVVPNKGKTSYFVEHNGKQTKTTNHQEFATVFPLIEEAKTACSLLNHLLGLVGTANHPACFVTEMSWPK